MAAIIAFLRTIFQRHLQFYADIFDRKIALRLAWIAFAASLLLGFFAAVSAILAGLSLVIPTWINVAASWVVPSNADACLSAYITVLVLKYGFHWKYQLSKASSGGF